VESADKPDSVLDGDLSMRPTRRVGGPRQPLPIWPCFRRGLPGRPVARDAGELLPHHFTLAPANRGGMFLWHFPSSRLAPDCPGRRALWSPDFPPRLAPRPPSGRLRGHCTPLARRTRGQRGIILDLGCHGLPGLGYLSYRDNGLARQTVPKSSP